MKKIYLLLVLLFTGLQSVFAQFIWHPDLGTPYAGAISLPWDTRSYMFQVDNGEEFGSPGDIWDALDTQLRAAGITWIRVNSVENPADGTFEVWFDLDENKDNMSRSIHMGYSYSAYFRFLSVRLNRLKNKLLANYLRNRGNDLATVRNSAFCVAILSNNSFICKYNIFFRKYELSVAIL